MVLKMWIILATQPSIFGCDFFLHTNARICERFDYFMCWIVLASTFEMDTTNRTADSW